MAVIYGTEQADNIDGAWSPVPTSDAADTVYGLGGNDEIKGLGGADTLYGGAGDDKLYGTSVPLDDGLTDTLIGGSGDDTYILANYDDIVDELADSGSGFDTIEAYYDLDMTQVTLRGSVERLVGINIADDDVGRLLNAYGSLDSRLDGRGGNDTIIGGGGEDVIIGGAGADTMDGGFGIDTVSYFNSTAGVTVGIGGSGAGGDAQGDTLTGFEILEGSAFNDFLGGSPTAASDTLYGLAGDDELKGVGGADRLIGGSGVDWLRGGAGDDTYVYDSQDTFDESDAGADGWDTIESAQSFTLGGARFKGVFEAIRLVGINDINAAGGANAEVITGNRGNNILSGYGGNDTLNGGFGRDTLRGGAGDDTYIIDAWDDTIDELNSGGAGIDTVQAGFSFSLNDTTLIKGSVENLTLTGGEQANGTGNALGNALVGNGAANVLNGLGGNDIITGGGGADIFRGGAGNDTYVMDADDIVDEASGGSGTDTIYYDASFSLENGRVRGAVENLMLLGTGAWQGTGNALDNRVTGNGGNNFLYGLDGDDILDGAAGADRLYGGKGDDWFIVDTNSDSARENVGEGEDMVLVQDGTALFTLFSASEIEVLRARDYASTLAMDLTGNGFAQTVTGSAGDNILRGVGGNDRLQGREGNDTLDGGIGDDRMEGGSGIDHYLVDSKQDQVIETVQDGFRDQVTSTVSLTLSANIEDLVLSDAAGTEANLGYGNAIDNSISGNSRNNTLKGNGGDDFLSGQGGDDRLEGGAGDDSLIGGAGADTLIGGAGNDVYTLHDGTDTVVEAAGGGVDTVQTFVSHTLADHVENLTLQSAFGVYAADGVGNALANVISGNLYANRITGGLGGDRLTGGGGADVFVLTGRADSSVADYDWITDLDATDVIDLSALDANTTMAGNQAFALVGAFTGTAGQLRLIYSSASGDTYVVGDVDGDTVADFRIRLTGDQRDYDNFVL